MTEDLGTIRGAIDLDTQPLDASARRAMDTLNQFERALNRNSQATAAGGRQMAQGMREAAGGAETLGRSSGQAGGGLDYLRQMLLGTGQAGAEAGRGLQQSSSAANESAGGFGRLSGGVNLVTQGLGALGLALSVTEIVRMGNDARVAANELEKTEAVLKVVAGSASAYAEVNALASENQLIFGGTLNDNLAGMRALTFISNSSGASLTNLTEAFRLLNLTSPEQGLEGASIALKEFLSASDASGANSLSMRFELDKRALQEIIRTTPDATERLRLLEQVMAEQGITSAALDAILNTNANTYDRLGVQLDKLTTTTGDYISRGLEPAARGLTRLLGGAGGMEAAGESVTNFGEQVGRGALRLIGLEGGLSAANEGMKQMLGTQVEVIGVSARATEEDKAREAQIKRTAAVQLAATGDIAGALDQLRANAGLTAEAMDELEEQLADAAEGGAKAFNGVLAGEVAFLQERSQARQAYNNEQAQAEQAFQSRLAELLGEMGQATTQQQRERLAQRIADLKTSHSERQEVEAAAFAEQERQAAEAYARQQAAQLAHLGQMLIDYVTAQASMAGIGAGAVAEMTARLQAEYGVQQSVAGRSFQAMQGSLDAWVANGGQNTDSYIGQMSRIREAATTTQQEVDRRISEMTAQAKEDFDAGKISAEEYAERLRRIPGAAEAAAQSLRTIPTRIESEVVVRFTREQNAQALADQRAGERGQTPTPAPAQRRPAASGPPLAGARAEGGPVAPNYSYIVGERGPELLVPTVPGMVLSNETLQALQSAGPVAPRPFLPAAGQGGGGMVFSPQISINHPVVDSAERLQQLSAAIVEQAKGAFSQIIERTLVAGV